MKINLKVLASFTGIFIAGAIAGGFISVRVIRHFSGEKWVASEQFGPQQMKKFTEQLQLSSEQRENIRPIIMQTAEHLKKARWEAFRTTTELLEDMEDSIIDELTYTQIDRLREMQAKDIEHRKQWMLERVKRSGDGHSNQEAGAPQPTSPQEHSKP